MEAVGGPQVYAAQGKISDLLAADDLVGRSPRIDRSTKIEYQFDRLGRNAALIHANARVCGQVVLMVKDSQWHGINSERGYTFYSENHA